MAKINKLQGMMAEKISVEPIEQGKVNHLFPPYTLFLSSLALAANFSPHFLQKTASALWLPAPQWPHLISIRRRLVCSMNEADMIEIADIITQVLDHPTDEAVHTAVRARVKTLCGRYPIYAW